MEKPRLDWAREWLKKNSHTLYYGGEWQKPQGSSSFTSINPATGAKLWEFIESNAQDVERAAAAAKSAFYSPAWRDLSRAERANRVKRIGAVIREHAAELATLETLDNGKTYAESFVDDLPESADIFDYYAGWVDKFYGETCPVERGFLNYTVKEPIGVCGLIVPWNFPLLLACWKIAPALAMGNTVVVKPAPFTSLTLVRLAELIHERQILPPGVFNLVLGGGEAGQALSQSPLVDKISFTGSTATGGHIVQSAGKSNLKALTLELGGKAPVLCFADLKNPDAVIARIFQATFSHKAEKCTEPARIVIEESIYDKFAAALVEKANQFRCGDPFAEFTQQGAQCQKDHFENILNYIRIGKDEGARLLCGGQRDTSSGTKDGLFIRPTIFGDVKQSMRIAREEIFGPVLCLQKFKTEDEAVQIANDTIYGLAAGAYTADNSRTHRLAARLEAGMVFLNHYGCYHFASPFGGIKQSGWGKEMAVHSLEGYTKTKSVWIRYEP
jgi:aldehyde dehydrogenase (NAD+)